jgi:hypothetical protein
MAEIKSGERRADLLDTLARMGSRESPGSYNVEMIVGAHDVLLEALFRATWVPVVTITQATAGLTSIATPTTSTIVATAGSWITAGVRVGDLIRLTGFNTTANNNINLRVKAVSALTITVHGTPLTIDAANDTTFSLTIGKKLSNPATPVRRTFYVEQRYADIDYSAIFGGVRAVGMHITGAPDGMALMDLTMLGGVPAQILSGASSPYYAAPTVPAGRALTFADCVLSFDGSDVVKATAFDLNYQIAASTLKVIGGAGLTGSPDVYDSKATLSGSISVARSDLAYVTKYLAESPLELHVMLTEPESEPKDYIALHVPNFILNAAEAPLGGDGAMIEQRGWTAGVKEGAAATGYDQSLLNLWTSAP